MKKPEKNFNRDVIIKKHEPESTAKRKEFKRIELPEKFVEIDYNRKFDNRDFRKKLVRFRGFNHG